jgi:antitoxin FitA
MATMTLKNVPDELYARLKETAARRRRSMNSEAILCLERALADETPAAGPILERAREIRADAVNLFVRDADLRKARDQGRP